MCREDHDILLEDGTTKIFFHTTGTKGNISKKTRNILKFIENNTPEDDFTERLAQEVRKIKENKEWQVEYMTLLMREREKYKEGVADGRIEGIAEGVKQGAVRTCKSFNLSFQETVQYLIDNFNLPSLEAENDVNRYWG